MEDWKEYKLGDIGTIVGGSTPSTKDSSNYDGNIAWITPKDLSNLNCRYISHGERMISQKGFDDCSCRMLPKNSILFSSRAPIGYVAIAQNALCTNQGFKSIIPNNEIVDSLFLYYLLVYYKPVIENMGSGTTFKEVSGSVMKALTVNIPNIDEQKRIAAILSSLDDKIELNRRINGNLEQQVQALFKAWFVDFEPFKSGKFVDSELGRIPEGWKVGRFNNIIESALSGDWGKERQEGNYIKKVFCLRGADIPDVKTGNKGYMPIRFILEKNFATKALTAGNLVIEISGGSPTQSTGRICRISHELLTKYNNSIVCTNFCKAIRPMVGYSSFMYYMWEKLYNEGVMFSYENGTTGIKNLDINGLTQKKPIIIPPIEVALNFEKYVDIYYNKIQKNGIESEQLSHLRDTLLPRLMSGEVNINTITE